MILALDSVFEQCSVALLQLDGKVISEQTLFGHRQQTQQILPMIDEILTKNQLTVAELSAIAFNRGPGAFSGIRINTAVAQAFSFAHDLPCLPISSLQAIAQTAWQKHNLSTVYAVMDARMNQVYLAEFILNPDNIMQTNNEHLLDYQLSTTQPFPLVGNGAKLLTSLEDQLTFEAITPTASIIGQLAGYQLQQGQAVTAEHALPVYLRHNAWKTLSEQKQS